MALVYIRNFYKKNPNMKVLLVSGVDYCLLYNAYNPH